MADQIRDAATLILLREDARGPQVLMGMRGAGAVFMPSKYVFPGGGVDPQDHAPLAATLSDQCLARLTEGADPALAPALANAALRELHEETGLRLGGAMRFVFRAVTPPGRTRRFDARFFMARAEDLLDDPDDFSRASDELGHLHWITLPEARSLALPFVTEVVLSEVQAALADPDANRPVPYFAHGVTGSKFLLLGRSGG